MNDPNHESSKKGLSEGMQEGYFKMQIAGFLDLPIVGQDPPIARESILGIIENISTRVELKQKSDRSPLPQGLLTVSRLARWFKENQLVDMIH